MRNRVLASNAPTCLFWTVIVLLVAILNIWIILDHFGQAGKALSGNLPTHLFGQTDVFLDAILDHFRPFLDVGRE